jgi:aminoacrylate peracid reductase
VKEERRVIDPGWRLYRDATFEPAVARGGIPMFVSGLNALEDDGSLQAPADIVAQLLMTAGATPSDVVKTVDYFTTLERYHETASIRREFFGEDFPASTGVLVAGLLGRGVVIEIEAVVMLQA